MNTISKYQGKNIGRINAIKFISYLDVDNISIPDDDYKVDVTLKTGKQFFSLYFIKGSGSYKESPNDSSAGTIWNASILCNVPKNRTEVQKMIIHPGYRYILIVTDGNDVDKVFGAIKLPLSLSATSVCLAGGSELNGYELEFVGNNLNPSPFLNSIITA